MTIIIVMVKMISTPDRAAIVTSSLQRD